MRDLSEFSICDERAVEHKKGGRKKSSKIADWTIISRGEDVLIGAYKTHVGGGTGSGRGGGKSK